MQQLAQPKNIIANNLNREMIEESSKFYVTKIVHASSFSLVSAAELALSSSGSSTLSPWGKSLHITKSSAEQIAEHFSSARVEFVCLFGLFPNLSSCWAKFWE